MVKCELRVLTSDQLELLQREYLRAQFYGIEAAITDQSLESDGRRRGRVLREAVNAGLLVAPGETLGGTNYAITAEVIAFVVPATPDLFEIWTALREKHPSREACDRAWIPVDQLPVEAQCGLLTMDDLDWYIVSKVPYEYATAFAEAPETISPGTSCSSFSQYWSGPFPTIEDAITHGKKVSGSCVAVSSRGLRQQVVDYFAERKLQRGFANNLLWGLVDLGIVPNSLVFDGNGNAKLDSQLDEGYTVRFSGNPNAPESRETVEWEANLTKSIERWETRIIKAEQQLNLLQTIQARVEVFGGWKAFMDALESRLRTATKAEVGSTAESAEI